jgi:hypothetical protein
MSESDEPKFIKWGRVDQVRDEPGTNYQNDFYCERTYLSRYSHKYPDRTAFKAALSKDKKLLDAFLLDRLAFIKSGIKSGGKCRFARQKREKRRKTLEKDESSALALIAPKDKFYHMNLYKDEFGDVNSVANKKAGHKKSVIHGFEGVIVPGAAEQTTPWEVERKWSTELHLKEVVDEVKSDDSEDFEGQLEDKYDDLKAEDARAYRKVCVGKSYEEILADAQAAEDAVEDAVADDIEGEVPQTIVESDPEEVEVARTGRGLRAMSSNEDDPKFSSARVKATAAAGIPKANAATKASAKAKFLPKAAIKDRKLKPKAAIEVKPLKETPGSGSKFAKIAEESGQAKKLGRKDVDFKQYADKLLIELSEAGESTVFCDPEKSMAQLRSVERYLKILDVRVDGAKAHSAEHDAYCLARKKLQIIESAVKCMRLDLQSGKNAQIIIDNYKVLDVFVRTEPVVDGFKFSDYFRCFILKNEMELGPGLDAENTSRAVNALCGFDESRQEEYIRLGVATHLRSTALMTSQTCKHIVAFLDSLVESTGVIESKSLITAIKRFRIILCPIVDVALSADDWSFFLEAAASLTAQTSENRFAIMLDDHKLHGDVIKEGCKLARENLDEHMKSWASMNTNMGNLRSENFDEKMQALGEFAAWYAAETQAFFNAHLWKGDGDRILCEVKAVVADYSPAVLKLAMADVVMAIEVKAIAEPKAGTLDAFCKSPPKSLAYVELMLGCWGEDNDVPADIPALKCVRTWLLNLDEVAAIACSVEGETAAPKADMTSLLALGDLSALTGFDDVVREGQILRNFFDGKVLPSLHKFFGNGVVRRCFVLDR